MARRAAIRAVLMLFLAVVAVAAQEYKVVLKDGGRTITGRLVSEDDASVLIEVGDVQTRFRKARLDLEKMKELNRAAAAKPQPVQQPARRTTGPYSNEDDPDYHRAALEYKAGLERKIGRVHQAIKELQAQPPSPKRDRDIEALRNGTRDDEKELENINVELGTSQDAEAVRLRNRVKELTIAVDREHREYFEALHRKAPPAELDQRMKTFLRLQQELGEAQQAFNRHMAAH